MLHISIRSDSTFIFLQLIFLQFLQLSILISLSLVSILKMTNVKYLKKCYIIFNKMLHNDEKFIEI